MATLYCCITDCFTDPTLKYSVSMSATPPDLAVQLRVIPAAHFWQLLSIKNVEETHFSGLLQVLVILVFQPGRWINAV